MSIHQLLFLLALSSVTTGCAPRLQRFEFQQPKLGAGFKIVLYASDQAKANRAAKSAFDRVDQLDAILSDYSPTSEISQLSGRTSAGPMAGPVHVSPELFFVLKRSCEVAKQTGGAFDVTVGPFGKLWQRSRNLGKLPTTQRLDEARASIGYKFIRLDETNRTVQLLAPKMRLDVSGIAVGYIVDEALKAMKKTGVRRALIDAAGDLGMMDPPPGKKGWRVAIQSLQGPGESTGQYVELANAFISTSGDTYRFVEIDGKRYSHILDPRTGLGLTDRIGVTVIAKDGITADWLDTAVAVMGREKGSALIESIPGAAARITTIDDLGRSNMSQTSRFGAFIADLR